MWILTATHANTQPATIVIAKDILIGRHQTADIQLQFDEVSRRHAGLSVQNEQLILIDLQSENGTFVNGQRIENDVILNEYDKIRFAHVEYQVQKNNDMQMDKPQLTVAEQMSEQGMLSLTERAGDVQISREGMPKNVGIPKPAPIPEGVDIYAQQPVELENIQSDVSQHDVLEQKKNVKIGFMSLMVLVIIGLLLLMLFW